ncbi:hypothetical protein D3C86_2222500 [compost metagenome]
MRWPPSSIGTGRRFIKPIETERIAARLIRPSNPPFEATMPETCAIRIGPESWSADSRPLSSLPT